MENKTMTGKYDKSKMKLLKYHGLIVSCQALEDEPLHGSAIMSKMAKAAKIGGATGIRANTLEDIKAIKDEVDLPVIGIVKNDYSDSDIYITPTIKEVDEVYQAGAEIVAIDATDRIRPNNESLEDLLKAIRVKYPDLVVMADISTSEEGYRAAKVGFDLISTTLSGYTEYTKHVKLPNYRLIRDLAKKIDLPIIAEGGIRCPKDLKKALKSGAFSAVIGSAITRPHLITKQFVEVTSHVSS